MCYLQQDADSGLTQFKVTGSKIASPGHVYKHVP